MDIILPIVLTVIALWVLGVVALGVIGLVVTQYHTNSLDNDGIPLVKVKIV